MHNNGKTTYSTYEKNFDCDANMRLNAIYCSLYFDFFWKRYFSLQSLEKIMFLIDTKPIYKF